MLEYAFISICNTDDNLNAQIFTFVAFNFFIKYN